MFALFSAGGRAVALFLVLVGVASGARFQVDALGGTFDVIEVPDGLLTSLPGEEKTSFLKRAGLVLHAYTRETGFEACSKIWTQGDRLAIRATTNRAHVGCITTDLSPGDGWARDADSINSHPLRPDYRTNDAGNPVGEFRFRGHGQVPVATHQR